MYRSEFCDVDYIAEMNIVFVTWKRFCRGDDYRNPLLHALEIMGEHPGCQYAADTRRGFENEEEDTRWLFGVFLPKAAQTSCKTIFFISREEQLACKGCEEQAVKSVNTPQLCCGTAPKARVQGLPWGNTNLLLTGTTA